MAITFLQPSDLNTDHFEIKKGKVCAKRTPSKYTLNWASSQEWFTSNNAVDYNNANRRYLQVVNGIGKFHMDFKPVKDITSARAVFTLPAGCPKPDDLVEVQTHDGGSIWITANSASVQCNGLKANTRYIVDLLAFFPDA